MDRMNLTDGTTPYALLTDQEDDLRFKDFYVNQKLYYAVGTDEETDQYVMEVIIGGIGTYSLYFRLTSEEIEAFNENPEALDRLAMDFGADKGHKLYKDRLIDGV